MRKYSIIYLENENSLCRINAKLAEEIGLDESLVLLQIDYLINIPSNEKCHDGKLWICASTPQLKEEYFPFWGTTKIKEIIRKLKKMGLLVVGKFNSKKYDRTNWYTIDYEKAKELKSLIVIGGEK